MSNQFDVNVERDADCLRLVLVGEIDMAAAPAITKAAKAALAQSPKRLVIDLSKTTFFDSAGINIIVALRNTTLDTATRLALRPGPPNVMRVLEIVGLADVMDSELDAGH